MNIKPSVAVACFLPGRAKDLSALPYMVHDRLQLNLIFSLINNFCYLVLSSTISAVETRSLSDKRIDHSPASYFE